MRISGRLGSQGIETKSWGSQGLRFRNMGSQVDGRQGVKVESLAKSGGLIEAWGFLDSQHRRKPFPPGFTFPQVMNQPRGAQFLEIAKPVIAGVSDSPEIPIGNRLLAEAAEMLAQFVLCGKLCRQHFLHS